LTILVSLNSVHRKALVACPVLSIGVVWVWVGMASANDSNSANGYEPVTSHQAIGFSSYCYTGTRRLEWAWKSFWLWFCGL